MALLNQPSLPPLRKLSKKNMSGSGALVAWRTHPSFGVVETITLVLFCAGVAITIPHHERSIDEAQAWLIARDNSLWQIVTQRLHYEGAPGLWHLVLHLFYLLHGAYNGINWLGAGFATIGMFVFLRWSPFPIIIRALIPLTFFFQYQYAVVARGYTLFPLLVFCLCILYPRKDKPIWFAATAGLLANLSFQGAMVGLTISALYLLDLYKERQRSFGSRSVKAAAAIYFAALCLSAYTAFPAPDISFPAGSPIAYGPMHATLVHFFGEAPHLTPDAPHFIFLRAPDKPQPSYRHPSEWFAWQVNHRASLTPSRQQSGLIVGHPERYAAFAPQSNLGAALEFIFGLASQATWPLATSKLLACLFLVVLSFWLRKQRALRVLIPWLAIILLGQLLWVADHHAGMIFTALLAGLWLVPALPNARVPPQNLHRAFMILFSAILVLQVTWSVSAIRKDIQTSYDPGPETAKFLNAHPVARTAAFRFHTVSIQPYVKSNPFFNVPHQYWLWSANTDPEVQTFQTLATRPDRIVYATEYSGAGLMRNEWVPLTRLPTFEEQRDLSWEVLPVIFQLNGYRETHRFCGNRFSRLETSYVTCNVIFEPDPNANEQQLKRLLLTTLPPSIVGAE